MEPESSLLFRKSLQLTATMSRIQPYHPIQFLSDPFLYHHIYGVGHNSDSFHYDVITKILYAFLFFLMHATQPTNFILLNFTTLINLVMSINYEDAHYVILPVPIPADNLRVSANLTKAGKLPLRDLECQDRAWTLTLISLQMGSVSYVLPARLTSLHGT
jgi:hypothetical protein